MLFRLIAVCVLIFLIASGPVLSQQTEIRGQVTDAATGNPLPGANILIRGTTYGTASDSEGRYRLTVPAAFVQGQQVTVEVRFVGYLTATQLLTLTTGIHDLNFALQSDVIGLEEVVVTALGITREERSLGYAISRVDGAEIVRSAQTSLANALRGAAPGLNIISSSGQPGKASRVEVRGISSITGENQPLWVIDGVIVSAVEDVTAGYESTLFTGGAASRQIDIDPNIIQDITVLKGASATALYGSRAAHGAIIITTKGALRETVEPRISYRSRVGWEQWHGKGFQTDYLQGLFRPQVGASLFYHGDPVFRNGLGWLDPRHDQPASSAITSGSWGPHKDSLDVIMVIYNGEEMTLREAFILGTGLPDVPIVDNRALFYRRPITYENAFSISGGVPGMNYFFSASNLSQDGIVPSTFLNRTSLNARFDGRIHPRLRVGSSVIYSRTENQWMPEGNGARAILWQLNFAPINFDLREYLMPDGVTQRSQIPGSWNNPYWQVRHSRYHSEVDRVIGSVNLEYSIFPWLTVAERLSFDTYTDTRKEEFDVGTRGRPDGSMFDRTNKRQEINSDLTVSAQAQLTDDIRMTALVGQNINAQKFKWERQRGLGLSVPGFFHIRNATTVIGDDYREERRLIGLYSSVTFDYREYLYLTLTARNDWSSTLPKDNNSFFYPSASIGFVFTDAFRETFRGTPINFGRLRAAYSQVGNDAPPYVLDVPYTPTTVTDGVRGEFLFPFRGLSAYTLTNVYGNPRIRPEITTEYEVGLDMRFFQGRARFDIAYYDRTSTDQIFNAPISSATGYSSMIVNAGEIRNYGVELTLGGIPIQTRDFSWDLRVNYAKNINDVIRLTEGVENIFLAGFTTAQVRIMEGKGNYGIIWSYRYDRTDKGDLRVRNVNPDDLPANLPAALRNSLLAQHGLPIVAPDLGNIGSVMPDWTGSLRSTMRYKGLELSALIDVRRGGKIFNMDMYYQVFYGTHISTADRWSEHTYKGIVSTPILQQTEAGTWVLVGWQDTEVENTASIIKTPAYYRDFFGNVFEEFVEDGSFVKLREISLTYTLPAAWFRTLPIRSAAVTFTGTNLWIDSKFSYLDPEGNLLGSSNAQGFYHMVVPTTRGYHFSINLDI